MTDVSMLGVVTKRNLLPRAASSEFDVAPTLSDLAALIASSSDDALERWLQSAWLCRPHSVEWAVTVFRAAGFTWNGRRGASPFHDTVTLFRGGSREGVSWTSERELAEAFREHHQWTLKATCRLWTAEVPAEAVLGHLTTLGLNEMIVDPAMIEPVRASCEIYGCNSDAVEDVRCSEHLKLRPHRRSLNLRMMRAAEYGRGICTVCGTSGAMFFRHPPEEWSPYRFRAVHRRCVPENESGDLLELEFAGIAPSDIPIILG